MARPKYPSDGGLTRRQLGLPANWRTSQSIRYFLQKQAERCAAKDIEPHRLAAMTACGQVILQLFMSEVTQKNREGGDGEIFQLEDPKVEPHDEDGYDTEGEFVDVETAEEAEMREDAENRSGDRYHTESGTIVALKPREK